MAYGFSVFWLPLSRALGASAAQACSADTPVWTYLTTTSCDWPVSTAGLDLHAVLRAAGFLRSAVWPLAGNRPARARPA